MSEDMNPSNWEAEAKQAYELLAEKDVEIARLKVARYDDITFLHKQVHQLAVKGVGIERKLKTAKDALKEAKGFLTGGRLLGRGSPQNTYIFYCNVDNIDRWHKVLAELEGGIQYSPRRTRRTSLGMA